MPSRPGTNPTRDTKPEYVSGWGKALGAGIRVGRESAQVVVVEFTDLECPACRRFQAIIREVLREYPQEVALVFVHTPLPGHRFAMQAARAADCAVAEGRFFPMVEAIFNKQDSLGLKSWGSFASDAGIADSASISACARDTKPVSRIDAGLALAERFEVTGTPTVLVNGWRFLGPSKEQLNRAIEAAQQGKLPTGN
jgi:protein-disulfide isomerase